MIKLYYVLVELFKLTLLKSLKFIFSYRKADNFYEKQIEGPEEEDDAYNLEDEDIEDDGANESDKSDDSTVVALQDIIEDIIED